MYIGAYIIAMYVKSVQSITDINYRQFFFSGHVLLESGDQHVV